MKLNEQQKSELGNILRHPVFVEAVRIVSSGLRRKGAQTIEAAALAQAFNEGYEAFADNLYALTEVEKPMTIQPRALRTIK